MPDRYIERKGIIFDQIAEKGDVDQATRLQKEKRNLMEKVERLEQEYNKLRKASEFIMSIIDCMDPEDLKKKMFERRGKELGVPTGLPPCWRRDIWLLSYYFNKLIDFNTIFWYRD